MKYLKLVRYKNLLMLALMQCAFHFGFLKLQNTPVALSDWQYLLFVLATCCIAAGGYLINNIYDVETDLENKPDTVVINHGIPESLAYNVYMGLNIVGVGLGFYLANAIGHPNFTGCFVIVAILLYMYANHFKQVAVLGNVVVALVLGFSVLIIGLFDLFPILNPYNESLIRTVFHILLDYAIFTFVINFIREIVKDLEDVNGDYNQGMRTLPIVLGVARTSKLVFVLSLIPIGLLIWYIYNYIFELVFATIYALVLIVAPLLFFTIKMWSAEKKKDFSQMSLLLKAVLFFGILSIVVISLNMKFNAAA